MIPVLKSGCLAKFDAFLDGLIKVRVLKVASQKTEVKVLENKGAYIKGEILSPHPRHVIPCKAVKIKNGFYRIGPYKIQMD